MQLEDRHRSARSWARLIAALCSCLTLACQLTPTFSTGYDVDQTALVSPAAPRTLAIEPFSEERDPRYYDKQGRVFLTYVPLLPYVTMRFERLDESVRIQSEGVESGSGITMGATQNVAPPFEQYYYPNSFARAVGADIAATGLFQKIEYLAEAEGPHSDYVLRGALKSTPLRMSTTSFGLGMAGVLLWLLPVPMAKTTAEVSLDLTLRDGASGDVVWHKQLSRELHRYVSLYTSSAMVYGRHGAFSFNLIPPPSDAKVDHRSLFSWHFEALRRAMQESKAELAEALRDRR